jgi:hypothetical protein
MVPGRIFLISPAHCGGRRGQILLSDKAAFPLAQQIRTPEGAPLGEVFSFLSGLYFRGKLAYARAFARPPRRRAGVGSGVLVITTGAGLCPPEAPVTVEILQALGTIDIRADNDAYRLPLLESARQVRRAIGPSCEVVLLGSIASPKYVDVLTGIFGTRLLFPSSFVGRGDMSRGGLLLRSVTAGAELDYVPVIGATRHGQRPPRLEPLRRS